MHCCPTSLAIGDPQCRSGHPASAFGRYRVFQPADDSGDRISGTAGQAYSVPEMVRFGKNGTDATSAAIRLARAVTRRDRIMALGYHGWQDWYIGATSRNRGVPAAVSALTHMMPYGDLAAVSVMLAKYPGEFAALNSGADEHHRTSEGLFAGFERASAKTGTLLIFDEVITGFRWSLGGAQARYGITPDLASFGKAMGNGMPISAVVGRADIMHLMEDVFFSGTFGGETLSLAAAIATIDKIEREGVIDHLWATGGELIESGAGTHRSSRLVRRCWADGRRPMGDPHLQGSRKDLEGRDQDVVSARDDRRRSSDQRESQCLLRSSPGGHRPGAGCLRLCTCGAARGARSGGRRTSPR